MAHGIIGGGLQVGVADLIVGLLAAAFGFPAADSIVLGAAVALSSTAVSMMSFKDLGQQNDPGARASAGGGAFPGYFRDRVLPGDARALTVKGEGSAAGQIGVALLKGGLFLIGAWLLGRYGLTPLLHAVARTRSRELFTLTVIGLCAGIAFAGGALNLSLALGAFAAGLVVSESIYSHRILSDILPFKDLFLAIFFISVGLLIDLSVIASDWHRVLLGSAVILVLKSGIIFMVLKWIHLPGRSCLAGNRPFSLARVSSRWCSSARRVAIGLSIRAWSKCCWCVRR